MSGCPRIDFGLPDKFWTKSFNSNPFFGEAYTIQLSIPKDPYCFVLLIYINCGTPEGRKPWLRGGRNWRETIECQTGPKLEFSLRNWFNVDFRTDGHCFFI